MTAVTFEIQVVRPGKRPKYYGVLSRPDEPCNYSELKDLLRSACAVAVHTPGIGPMDQYTVGMKTMRNARGGRWDLVGLFTCVYSPQTLQVDIRRLQLSPLYRQIKDEYFMVEKNVKYPEPPLMDRDPDRFDPMRAAVHREGDMDVGQFQPLWQQGFHGRQPEGSFDSYRGSEFSSNPHHASRVHPARFSEQLLEGVGKSKDKWRSELRE